MITFVSFCLSITKVHEALMELFTIAQQSKRRDRDSLQAFANLRKPFHQFRIRFELEHISLLWYWVEFSIFITMRTTVNAKREKRNWVNAYDSSRPYNGISMPIELEMRKKSIMKIYVELCSRWFLLCSIRFTIQFCVWLWPLRQPTNYARSQVRAF